MSSIVVPSSTSNTPSPTPETPPPHPLPKSKLNAISRFKSFAGSLGLKKESKEPPIVFPPPSWFITDDEPTPASPDAEPTKDSAAADDVHGKAELDALEPMTFAMKIRRMIDTLPLPASVTAVVAAGLGTPSKGTSNVAVVDEKGPPIPDVVDARTMKLLTSEEVMNGDDPQVKGTRRQSVWAALERLRHGHVPVEERTGAPPIVDSEPEEGVMMYAPLEPTEDSEIELAESELEYADEEPTGKDADKEATPPISQPPALEKVWVPSTTKLSIFTTWWGYRLYLPPPVMAKLNSSQMRATQRAALITTALQWFLGKVPMVIVPPQLKPAVTVLRRLSPLLAYIGVFIAWSWSRISASDKGDGVVLTATWLLPVALIPMSWDAGHIHGPPNRPPTPMDNRSPSPKDGNKGKNTKK
ncbi:hypothetical protein FPV67DRAFT_95718 [Lyophyllum atratum]|nr:hypothetical protein FPV67DRAFT_95718 [Lyophyllum atratum]